MGFRPIAYRALHVLLKKTGLLKKKFPSSFPDVKLISLQQWRKTAAPFFFNSREDLKEFTLEDTKELKDAFNNLKNGHLQFFNGNSIKIGRNYDWISNPESRFKYDIAKHWTEIETLDPAAGDIKYVWEKSRFCFLYTIIRYDYHFKQDQSEYAISEIISWIDSNPLNMGPNYTCSQELSIRMLNWIFALYYYRNSPNLTEEKFAKILTSIYGQAQHVDKNLSFSLNTVRNNHAITECLLLYTVGTLFPFYEESKEWKEKGKRLLEEEGFYQIYDDGSYLQFSMNYERVVIQLYTWAFYLAKANKDSFSTGLKERLNRAITFLNQCQDEFTGRLPNYGANDGALFFPLNNCSFRNYKPQLNALYYLFSGRSLYGPGIWNEDMFWFSGKITGEKLPINRKTRSFETGGYHILRDPEKFTFIRCGNHEDRPSQADNLHVDIWLKGVNILRDCGSYRYNTSPEDVKFFMGTASHNTVMVGDYDQMEKGGRFLWYHWSQSMESKVETHQDFHIFTGKIHAFKHVKSSIFHSRTVKQYKREMKWEIKDVIENNKLPIKQIWNIYPEFFKEGFEITCKDKNGKLIEPIIQDAYYSSIYGVKEKSKQVIFITDTNYFNTVIIKK
jgi:hypothetical protein